MLWSIDSSQNRVSTDQYHLTVSWAQVPTHRGWVFFEVTRWQVTSFQMIARLIFFKKNSYEICCVYVPHNKYFDFKRTSDAKFQRAITGSEDSCFWLFSPWSRVGHALRPIFMLWLVKIWQVSSWENLYSILKVVCFDSGSWQSLCQLVMFLTAFFHWMYKMKFSCYQESSVIHG